MTTCAACRLKGPPEEVPCGPWEVAGMEKPAFISPWGPLGIPSFLIFLDLVSVGLAVSLRLARLQFLIVVYDFGIVTNHAEPVRA